MRKHGYLSVLFALLFGFMFLKVVDDDGAGGGDVGDEDIDDDDLKDDLQDDKKKEDEKNEDKKEPPAPALSDEDRDALEEYKTEKALKTITQDIKSRHPEFDASTMEKIVAHLKEKDTKEKGSGQALFNQAGIELTYLNEFKNEGEDDPDFENGRGGRETSFEELTAKVRDGKADAHEREALFLKFV